VQAMRPTHATGVPRCVRRQEAPAGGRRVNLEALLSPFAQLAQADSCKMQLRHSSSSYRCRTQAAVCCVGGGEDVPGGLPG